jgi:chemotaxis protein methyltransferase CheR
VRILATDISPDALAHARRGIYGERSLRELEPALRTRYFSETLDGRLAVGPTLRSLVAFDHHNLISAPFPPLGQAPFDLVLCRNVLIYFGGETVGRVLASFQQALAPGGALVLGAADALCAGASTQGAAAAAPAAKARRPSSGRPLRRPLGRAAGGMPATAPGARPGISAGGAALVAPDPLTAAAYFRRGLAELESDDPAAAVGSLRRALYVEPQFGLAAFKLGGAHEALGDVPAARRAYEQALRALEPDERHEAFLAQIDLADVATAVRTRLRALAPAAAAERASAARR